MFNTSNYHAGNHTNNIKINAVTGAILKNHPKSWFERFNLNSQRANQLLVEGGDSGSELVHSEYCKTSWRTSNPEKQLQFFKWLSVEIWKLWLNLCIQKIM